MDMKRKAVVIRGTEYTIRELSGGETADLLDQMAEFGTSPGEQFRANCHMLAQHIDAYPDDVLDMPRDVILELMSHVTDDNDGVALSESVVTREGNG